MLDQLELLCADLSALQTSQGNDPIVFGFGTSAELNVLADSVGRSFLLFHEGYFKANPRIVGGHLQHSYQLSLMLFCPALLSDSPEQSRAVLRKLYPVYSQLIKRIDNLGIVSNMLANGDFAYKVTDRVMNGINITLTLTTDPESLC